MCIYIYISMKYYQIMRMCFCHIGPAWNKKTYASNVQASEEMELKIFCSKKAPLLQFVDQRTNWENTAVKKNRNLICNNAICVFSLCGEDSNVIPITKPHTIPANKHVIQQKHWKKNRQDSKSRKASSSTTTWDTVTALRLAVDWQRSYIDIHIYIITGIYIYEP